MNDRLGSRLCQNTHGRDGISKSFAKKRTSVVSFGISGRETQNETPVRVVRERCREFLHRLGRFLPLSAALRQHVVMLRLHLIEIRHILLSQSNGLEVQNALVVKDSLKVGTLRSL